MLGGELAGEVAELKGQFAGDILVAGSAQLVRALLADGLVDELRLMVFPTVLGAGKRLFEDGGAATSLKLVDTKQTGEVAILTFAR